MSDRRATLAAALGFLALEPRAPEAMSLSFMGVHVATKFRARGLMSPTAAIRISTPYSLVGPSNSKNMGPISNGTRPL